MARGGAPDHPVLSRLLLARMVNAAHGGPVIAAWEVDQLDDVTLDALVGFQRDLPGLMASAASSESRFAEWRARSGYRAWMQ